MADVGTDAMEREKAFLFASAEGRMLLEINEALRRLYRGEYGICEICGKPIARARLEAMPHARLCVCVQGERGAAPSAGAVSEALAARCCSAIAGLVVALDQWTKHWATRDARRIARRST